MNKVKTSRNYNYKDNGRHIEGKSLTVPNDAMTVREIIEKYVIVPNFEKTEEDFDTDFNVDPGNRLGVDEFEAHEILIDSKRKYDEAMRKKKDLESKMSEAKKLKLEKDLLELNKLKKEKENLKNSE